ncbi:DNA/RNA non-specific endonuclease [Chitinophagaceae bacterium MMS25-I14]
MPTLLEQAFARETLLACKGYLPSFIDNKTSIGFEQIIPSTGRSQLPDVAGNKKGVLNYTDLSVLYNSERKVPFFSAYNIDGSEKASGVKRAASFRPDPRIPEDIQLSQKGFYDLIKNKTEFEIGHMAANNEMAWGKDAQLKSYQTFHFPNSVPQAEKLNTGLWKTLESYIIDEAAVTGNKRICVFTGPLLRSDDPAYVKDPSFKIPLLFYKVVVFMSSKGPYATAFMMSHEEKMIEDKLIQKPGGMKMMAERFTPGFDDFKYKKVFQVNISYLEANTGLNFSWKNVKTIQVPDDKNQLLKIRKIKDAGDAARAEKKLVKGIVPETMKAEMDISPAEMKNKLFRLNMILP